MPDITFTPVITAAGFAAALAAETGGFQINITHIATGSTGYVVPVNASGLSTKTALTAEKDRVAIQSAIETAPGQTDISFVISSTNEYFVREVGFFLSDGTLFAIAAHPTTALMWKSAQTQAAIAFELLLQAVNPATINIISSGPPLELLLTNERARLDALEADRALKATTITAAGLATGGGNLGANRVITVTAATQAQAEAMAVNTVGMTPLSVGWSIAKKIADGVVQAGSSILTAISALATNGFVVRTAAGVVAARSIVGTGGITVTNPDGVAGNPSIALNGQAAALDTLVTSGLIARTAADVVAARSIAVGAGLTVANPDGVAGNPTLGLSFPAQAVAELGTDPTLPMNALRTAQLIAAKVLAGVVQAGSSILTAISALATNGFVVRTAAGVVAARSIVGTGGITVTNPDGVAGNPSIALNGQAAALDTLVTSGLIVRTAADVVAARSIAVGAGLTVTNPDGVAGNPTLGLSFPSQAVGEAGADATLPMNALRTAQLIAAKVVAGVAQAGSTILTAISALATNGFMTRTAAGAIAARVMTGGNGITVTNGDGVAGNPTFTLNGQTASLDVLATNGMIVRTAADTVAARSIAVGAGLSVVNPAGTAGNPTLGLVFPTQPVAELGTDATLPMNALRTAQAIIDRNPGSYGTAGWMKLPGGMILQWGRYSVGAAMGTSVAVTMPIAFPNYHLAGWVGVDNAATDQLGIIAPTVTGMTIKKGAQDPTARTGTWFAIGY